MISAPYAVALIAAIFFATTTYINIARPGPYRRKKRP